MENKKIIDLDSGKYMIVADLHGNLQDYERTKEIYQKRKEASEVKGLIIAGDFVHAYEGKDESKEIVDDLIKFTQEDSNVHVLLGNHEFLHVYNFLFFKGNFDEFTHRFELAIKDDREKYINFFKSLPLYIRTKGGVLISHTGASKEVNKLERLEDIIGLNHDEIIKENMEDPDDGFNTLTSKQKEEFKKSLEERFGMPYEEVLKKTRGIDSEDKERYESLLQGEYFKRRDKSGKFENPDAMWLLDILCNGNEGQYGNFDYLIIINEFLEKLSEGYTPQNLIISGHIHSRAGFDVFEDMQLRIISGAEIIDPAAKSFVVIDTGKKYSCARELADNIHSLYPEAIDESLFKKVEELSKKHPIKTMYNIATKHVEQTNKVNKNVLAILGQYYAQDKTMVEDSIKPKSAVLNDLLLKAIKELEKKKDVKIGDIITDGGSFYKVNYELLPEKKGCVDIGYMSITDNHPEQGSLQVIPHKEGFVNVVRIDDIPTGRMIQLENGMQIPELKRVPFFSDKNTVDKLVNSFREKEGDIPEEHRQVLYDFVFKRSVLEDPYTDLNEEEFFKKLLEQESKQDF